MWKDEKATDIWNLHRVNTQIISHFKNPTVSSLKFHQTFYPCNYFCHFPADYFDLHPIQDLLEGEDTSTEIIFLEYFKSPYL